MEEKKIYEVRVGFIASYTALVKAGNGEEAVKAAEELAMEASPAEFEITDTIAGSVIVDRRDAG